MKRIVGFCVAVMVVFLLVPADVSAAQTGAKPNMFNTLDACKTALASGNFQYYEPKYFGLNSKDPLNGTDRVPVRLESDTCLNMFVVGGWKFVVQKDGTLFRARKLADGSLVLYARDDCGNPVRGIVFPAPEPVQSVRVVQAPEPQPTRREIPRSSTPTPPAPIDTVRAPVVVPPVPVVERYQPEVEPNWNIGITTSAMVGVFNSSRIAGMVESLTDRQVCVTGRMFDFGFAQGGQRSSIWRGTVVLKQFDKGSYTQYVCTDCNLTVKTTTETGARVFGLQIERIQRISWNQNWVIQPMVTANVGMGHVSGEAVQRAGDMAKHVGARELFGSDWFPMAGVGLGVMGDLGQHFTWHVTAVGIEYPGTYYGRVGLTYWLK